MPSPQMTDNLPSHRGSLIGTLLVRLVVPLWLLAGASVKLWLTILPLLEAVE